MTGSSGSIEHEGIVKSSDNKSVTVSIIASSACSGCHAESICSLSGREEKIVEIPGNFEVSPGENVKVVMKQSSGYSAVFLGYGLPILLVILMLVVLISFSMSELSAGLGAIAVLVPYYIILYLFRKKISRKFTLTLKTI